MSRRLALLALTGIAVAGATVPALASSSATQPVTVTYSTDGGVYVGTAMGSQPLASAAVANGEACVGFSYEVPFCATLPTTVVNVPRNIDVGPVHAYVNTSNGVSAGTALGSQPLAYAGIGNGWACIGFSYEIPYCYPLNQQSKTAKPAQSLPIVFYHDDNRTVVGVEDVGVVIYSDGTICPVVSTQAWRCIPGAGA